MTLLFFQNSPYYLLTSIVESSHSISATQLSVLWPILEIVAFWDSSNKSFWCTASSKNALSVSKNPSGDGELSISSIKLEFIGSIVVGGFLRASGFSSLKPKYGKFVILQIGFELKKYKVPPNGKGHDY